MWYLISDGGAPKVCTKTGPTSYSGAGAPEQLISQGVTYYDTIEKRTYTKTGGSWVLTGGRRVGNAERNLGRALGASGAGTASCEVCDARRKTDADIAASDGDCPDGWRSLASAITHGLGGLDGIWRLDLLH
jgi:hypothetical protein